MGGHPAGPAAATYSGSPAGFCQRPGATGLRPHAKARRTSSITRLCADLGWNHLLITLANRAKQPRADATDPGRPSTSANERSMAQMLPFIVLPTALPLTAHRVSFFLLPAWLELGSRRCLPGIEEDEKKMVLHSAA